MKTKTKPTPRARRMWANYYSEGIVCHAMHRKARISAPANCLAVAIPVAVIPLHDLYALGDAMVSALAAIGVLPRKGGRK